MSLPSRECGLKYSAVSESAVSESVTPLAGVWIEIYDLQTSRTKQSVTPLAGVWIEI